MWRESPPRTHVRVDSSKCLTMSQAHPSKQPQRELPGCWRWETPRPRESTDCFILVRIITTTSFPGCYFCVFLKKTKKKQSKLLLPGLSAGEVPLKNVTISSKALDIITPADLKKELLRSLAIFWQSQISSSASSSPRPTQITFQSPWGLCCRTRIVLLVIEWHFISHRPNPHMVTGCGRCREYGRAATLWF